MGGTVVDASALLAFVQDEPGGSRLPELVGEESAMSAANWSEVVQKAARAGSPWTTWGRRAARSASW